MSSPIPEVYRSVVRSTVDLITQLNTAGVLPALSYHDWESRGDESALPQTTLLGVDGFSFDTNEGRWLVRYALGLSSYRDVNLINEIDFIGKIDEAFGQGNKIALRDANGVEYSQMVVSAFQVLPMAQSELRNYRTIGIELLKTAN